MVRLGGALLVLLSSSLIGWLGADKFINRVTQLEQLELAINLLQMDINFRQKQLPEVLRAVSRDLQPPVAILFEETGKRIKTEPGVLFYNIWEQVLKNKQQYLALNKKDLLFLKEWGLRMGSSSIEEQEKINRLTLKKIKMAHREARQEAARKVKLYRCGGILIGLSLVILFF